MSILNSLPFIGRKETPTVPAPQPTPAVPVANGAQGSPTSVNPQVTPTVPASPLDAYAKLWDNAPNVNGPALAPTDPLFSVKPNDWQEIASKATLVSPVTPEVFQAIQAGGEQGLKAFEEAQRSLAQNVFAQSLSASAKLIEAAMQKNNAAVETKLPGFMKQHQVTEALVSANPALKHDAANFVIQTVANRIAMQNPTLPASDIAMQTTEYLKALLSAAVPSAAPTQPAGPQVVDWATYAKG